MNLIQLQKSLRAVEPAAVLVPPRVLQNIIKQHWNLSGFYWTVPHRDTFIIDRQTLFFGHVDQEDLALEPNELLPPTVMLLAWPGSEEIPPQECPALLLKYWQLVFHASVHLRLENQWNEGKLTPADLRSRIAEIGAAQFDEIKNVLVQDKCLPAAAGERLIYVEFAAHFLEEYYFASGLLDGTFPGLKDKEAIRKLLEQDVDGADLFKRTRLAGAAEPEVKTVSTSKEAHEFYYKLVGAGDRASQAGNVVLAAIQRQRAARVGPADLASKTLQQARADMHDIAGRLQKASASTTSTPANGNTTCALCWTRPIRVRIRPRRPCFMTWKRSASTTNRTSTPSIWWSGSFPWASGRSSGRCRANGSFA